MKYKYKILFIFVIIVPTYLILYYYLKYSCCAGFKNYANVVHQFFSDRGFINPSCSNTPNRILTVASGGRLGNIIWEYMSVVAFQKIYSFNGTIVLYPDMKENLQYLFHGIYNAKMSDFPEPCIRGIQNNSIGVMETPKFFNFSQNNLLVILQMYSCRFNDVLDYGLDNMRKKLRFHKEWIAYGTNTLKEIKATFGFEEVNNVTFIGVHYRGGDYNSDLMNVYQENFVGPPSFLYYRKAMEYFQRTTENPIFVFTTIDQVWASKNLRYLRSFKIFEQSTVGAVQDFVTLSLCNHSIISYGTYGVASAIFAHGTTFVYDLKLPNDGRGYTLANNMAQFAPNWFLCDDTNPCNTGN